MNSKKILSSRSARYAGNGVLLLAIIAGSVYAGIRIGQAGPISDRVPGYIKGSRSETEAAKDIDFKLFWQAWNVIDQKFYGDKDPKKRVEGAIGGMVAGLKDPYTVYMEPAQNQIFRSDLQGTFGGIGAELTVKDGLLTVVSALEDTPAEQAGVKAQDIILEIDGKKTTEMSFNDAITTIRGDKGTQVELTIARKGDEEPLKLKITRDVITVKSVKTDTVGANKDIAYIKLNQFGDDSTALVQAALEQAKSSGKKGVVLDLRNNPGGYLTTATNLIGMVLPEKVESSEEKLRTRTAVIERGKDGEENLLRATTTPIVPDLPLVVLVNGGSASASEIFAGAMKDYGRAKVVGTKTFGKGSVQDLIDLSNGGSIKVTIAKWFTPLGHGIDGTGIDPDVVVELPADTELSTTDAQMAKALEILSASIK